jgi:hypothetical protein
MMLDIAGQNRSTGAWVGVAGTLLLLAISSRVGMIAWPFLNDSGLYIYMGKTVATGGVLYRDFYETKLPGVGLIASVFWRAFGESWSGYVLSQLALALLAAGFLGRAARRHIRPSAALPTFLFAAVFLNFAWAVYTGFQLETIQAFFEVVAAAVMLEALKEDRLVDALIAGMAAGFAAMVKPSGIGVGIAFAIALLIQRKTILRSAVHLGMFLLGAAIPASATLLYAIRSGAASYLPRVLWQIERYVDATPMGTLWPLELTVVTAVLIFPMAVRLVLSRRDIRRETRSQQTPVLRYSEEPNSSPIVLPFAIAWFLIDLAGIMMQRRMYLYHFLPLVCPAALFYGLLPWRARPFQVLLGLLPIALLSFRWEGTDLSHISRGFRHEALSEYVSAHTSSGDSVFADQIGRLLIETGRDPGSRFGTFFYFVNYDTAPQDYSQEMLSDFQGRKPKYVLLKSSRAASLPRMTSGPILSLCPERRANFVRAWQNVETYVSAHYYLETVIDGTDIYRRRTSSDALAGVRDE